MFPASFIYDLQQIPPTLTVAERTVAQSPLPLGPLRQHLRGQQKVKVALNDAHRMPAMDAKITGFVN